MNLRNPFPIRVRIAFIDYWECYLCGSNGSTKGGLELHHIKGRESYSALNASVLCKECHSHIGHTEKEESFLMGKTIRFLVKDNYQFHENDLKFYQHYKKIYDAII